MTLQLVYRGFNYPAYYNGAYANADNATSLADLAATNSDSVAMNLEYGYDPSTSMVFADYGTVADPGFTDTLGDLASTIHTAEQQGLSVMVRPLIDVLPDETAAQLTDSNGIVYPTTANGEWRAEILPTNIANFFSSYDTLIVAQAQVAQAQGAQLFCIGTELDQLTGPAYLSEWTKIISDVRAVFSGKLTYSAIGDDSQSPWNNPNAPAGGNNPPAGTGNIATQVSFWSQLDYVGIDEYETIADQQNNAQGNPVDPTEQQLVAGWEQPPTDASTSQLTGGQSLIQYYEGVANTIGKPLLFTELGYETASDAAAQPFGSSFPEDGNGNPVTYDPSLQAKLYQAFFTAWQQDGTAGPDALQGVYIWNWEPDPSADVDGVDPNFTPQGTANGVDTGSIEQITAGYAAAAACYATGTRIATPSGEIAVEDLAAGDLVMTDAHGSQPVVWIGHRNIDCRRHPVPESVWPVRVRAHAFGPGRPMRDLILSPDHAVFVSPAPDAPGVLVPIRYLRNGATIVQEARDRVTYWHVELARHDILLAEGMPAESFLDTGNRSAFDNCDAAAHMAPDFALRVRAADDGVADVGAAGVWTAEGCAALVTDGPVLAAIHRRTHADAARLGYTRTDDPALHVVANGRAIWPETEGERRRFRLPPGTRRVRLVSRAAVPANDQEGNADHRRLGVAVAELAVDGENLSLAGGRLGAGWHPPEGVAHAGWRWTDGSAEIDASGAATLDIRVVMRLTYWAPPEAAAARMHRAA